MRVLPVILVLLLYLSGNFYVFYRLWQALPWHAPLVKGALIAGGIVLVSAMVIAFVAGNFLPAWLTGLLHGVGTTWIFVFLYLLLATLARDLFLWAGERCHLLPATASVRWLTWIVAAGVVAIILLAGHARYLVKERVEFTVDTGKVAGRAITIVAISDLHLGYGIGDRELARWVRLINAERPDVVLVAGDIIDNSVRPLEEGQAASLLRGIEAPWGVHACPGNHEYIAGVDRGIRFLERAGVRVARDTALVVGGAFTLVGRDDRSNPRRAALRELTRDVDRALPLIVLDHQPYRLDEAVEQGVDLQLSGHTHRGQVWPFSWITDRLFELSHGHELRGTTHLHVTSGIGLWGGKFRVGTRSEYLVIHLK